MAKIQVFLDTDVIISSLLSKTGASFNVINIPKIEKIITNTVSQEVKEVGERLNIEAQSTVKILNNLKTIALDMTKKDLIKNYGDYVIDEKDSHLVAGAYLSKSKFLLSHNSRHYKANKIENDLRIIVIKPGNFLQYLRSINEF
ncbi:MAG: hypothetical protein UV73_C0003G0110 [Candidatus Gottesmanbacteria bacterium GW2011_GWA2_43_14]|uniref:PIN domain-containing protein n=1 Tax=Candidatus Gottesmanbacteria bacterium GW2011_GWA2_43_14 TaxID=1618443 RepID=A0A0G1GHA6_9BACT|nr:MAG: hypothetical protein UV73_C0003G0110 [Candidatus Gottesmanbacteria bacterium GW2011_GWA2_43_14]